MSVLGRKRTLAEPSSAVEIQAVVKCARDVEGVSQPVLADPVIRPVEVGAVERSCPSSRHMGRWYRLTVLFEQPSEQPYVTKPHQCLGRASAMLPRIAIAFRRSRVRPAVHPATPFPADGWGLALRSLPGPG